MICLHMNQIAYLACNFNCLFENEGLLKVTQNRLHSKCGVFLEMVQDKRVITTDH